VRRAGIAFFVVVVLLVGARFVHHARIPAPPRPDDQTFEQAKRVRIVRDVYGVPHVFGKSDADAAFGLAYAHSEDDWPTIHAVVAASTGRLGLLHASKNAIGNDWYVALVRVREQVAEQYETLSPEYRAVLEAYARGLNLYAWKHPDESDGRLFPVTGRDIAASFAHKLPYMLDVTEVISELVESRPPKPKAKAMPGSNAHAVAGWRSPDGVTRLNVNSHQPWEGPVTWYEAHVTSEEGMNMTGGTFPGAPMILHGHNDHLGWAHTVNFPDLVDVYELKLTPDGNSYVLDGKTLPLETKEAPLAVDIGVAEVHFGKPVYWSVHGPVVKTDKGAWAIRWAGIGHALHAGEQWWRMNKAASFDAWKAAMRMNAIPMFNTVYADREHIFYVYNALIPKRHEEKGLDWSGVLPGDRGDLVWKDYLAWDDLPHVEDPPSGFVQTCNATPFMTTTGPGNPRAESFPPSAGIETTLTNRSARSLALFGADGPIDRETFLRFKFDRTYAADSEIQRDAVQALLAGRNTWTDLTYWEKEALDILSTWDSKTDEHSSATTIAVLAWSHTSPHASMGFDDVAPMPPRAALKATVDWLVARFGRVSVQWGEVNRLRRGDVDIALGGGPDVLNAVRAKDDGSRLRGFQGDSYVLVIDFVQSGVTSESIHQYGASNRPDSPHYSDQARSFAALHLKPTFSETAALGAKTERSYTPLE